MLFDLEADIGESTNVAGEHPEVVQRLLGLAKAARDDLGAHDRRGRLVRTLGGPDLRPDLAGDDR